MAQAYTPPTDYKSGLEQVLTEAGNIYQQKKAAGYPTYTGPQIAGFAPEELAAMQGISSLVGAGQSYFTPATALTMGTARQFTPTEAATYMSPYQQAVVDVEKREAARAFAPQMQNIGAQAAQAGSFGGSRQAILESEAMRNQNQLLADIQTRGSQRAFDTAQRAFESQLQRERQAASGLASLGQVAPRQALAELTALSGIGEAQRGMTQAGLDIAKQQFERQQQYPYDLLGQYQSTLYGYPYQAFQQFQPVAKPSSAQNLAGILGAVGKIGGSFGLFKEGGHVAFRSQGGLSGMAQKLAEGSTIGSDDLSDFQNKSATDFLKDYLMAQKKAVEAARETSQSREAQYQEQLDELMKQTSPVNYVSDLLIGYAAADPEAGMGAQLGAAAQYATEEKEKVKSKINKIKDLVAEGKLSAIEAEAEFAKLGLEGYETLRDIQTVDIDFGAFGNAEKIAESFLSKGAVNTTEGRQKVSNALLNARNILRKEVEANPAKYKDDSAAQETRYYEIIKELIQGKSSSTAPAGVSSTVQSDTENSSEQRVPLDELIDSAELTDSDFGSGA